MQEAEETSVISLKAMDIVSHEEEPSFTDQFIEVLPDLEGDQVIYVKNHPHLDFESSLHQQVKNATLL